MWFFTVFSDRWIRLPIRRLVRPAPIRSGIKRSRTVGASNCPTSEPGCSEGAAPDRGSAPARRFRPLLVDPAPVGASWGRTGRRPATGHRIRHGVRVWRSDRPLRHHCGQTLPPEVGSDGSRGVRHTGMRVGRLGTRHGRVRFAWASDACWSVRAISGSTATARSRSSSASACANGAVKSCSRVPSIGAGTPRVAGAVGSENSRRPRAHRTFSVTKAPVGGRRSVDPPANLEHKVHTDLSPGGPRWSRLTVLSHGWDTRRQKVIYRSCVVDGQ